MNFKHFCIIINFLRLFLRLSLLPCRITLLSWEVNVNNQDYCVVMQGLFCCHAKFTLLPWRITALSSKITLLSYLILLPWRTLLSCRDHYVAMQENFVVIFDVVAML